MATESRSKVHLPRLRRCYLAQRSRVRLPSYSRSWSLAISPMMSRYGLVRQCQPLHGTQPTQGQRPTCHMRWQAPCRGRVRKMR